MDATLFHQIWISAAMIGATVLLHAVFVSFSATVFRTLARRAWGPARFFRDTVVLVLLGMWLMVAHAIEMGMWAMAYLSADVFQDWSTALYFSSVTYTTLGFGGVAVPEEWRLLSGATAASGLLLFGLSAAVLVETSAKLRIGGET